MILKILKSQLDIRWEASPKCMLIDSNGIKGDNGRSGGDTKFEWDKRMLEKWSIKSMRERINVEIW